MHAKLPCDSRDQLDDLKDKNLGVQMHVELPQVWTPVTFMKIFS